MFNFNKAYIFSKIDQNRENLVFLSAILIIFITSYFNYLLFHSLVEMSSVVVATIIFILTLNAYKRLDNSFVLIVGIGYLFVGVFDMLHAFSYFGLNVFSERGPDLPTQLWISSRYIEASSLFIGLILLNKKISLARVFNISMLIAVFLLLSIFYWRNFPTTFIDGVGLTPFKILSEYIVCILLFISSVLLYKNRKEFDEKIYKLLNYSIAFTILAELTFTLYSSVYDFVNAFGHFFKLISFYLIYKALIEISIKQPHRILYRNLKKSQKKYSDLFSSMSSGFALYKVIKDGKENVLDYKFIEANEAFQKLIGLKADEIINKRMTEVIPGIGGNLADWIGNYEKAAVLGEKVKFEQFLKPLGKYYSVTAYSPSPGYFATIFDDVTKEKEVDNAKSEFISFVSHELKTPLASIMLTADLLLDERTGQINSDQKDYLRSLRESTKDMNDFIVSLLNVSRIESGRVFLNSEPIDINMQIKILIGRLEELIKKKNITIGISYNSQIPILLMDEKIFDLILNNLFTNAIRYTPAGGKVNLQVSEVDDCILFEIRDTGCGIPDEDKDKIFSKLFRAENARQMENQGTGLGLYIVKNMVEKIGAEIWFESKQHHGTSFFVKFPLDKFKA